VIVVQGKPLYIPARTSIAYGLQLMQKRKDLWGEDADVFDPERWLDHRVQIMTASPFIFQPFSAGPRICLGQNFAYNEVSSYLILANDTSLRIFHRRLYALSGYFKSIQILNSRQSVNLRDLMIQRANCSDFLQSYLFSRRDCGFVSKKLLIHRL
jgi:hypothetical protein